MKYPHTLKELQEELHRHAQDGRNDALFRLAITLDQFGSLSRYLTHDQTLNPITRPHGSRQGEIHDAGHAIVQLMTYCDLRGINIDEAVCIALDNLREKDFIKREANNTDTIVGETAMPGVVRGKAVVILNPDAKRIEESMAFDLWRESAKGEIIVTSHPTAENSHLLTNFAGIITDHGGTTCHAAIIARESEIPCVVGTGNATELIKSGDLIEIIAMGGTGKIRKVI